APPPPAAELYDVELATAAIMLPGGETLVAEIAATGAEQAKGLMFRKRLGPRQGMLFPFRDARVWQFWMKDTWLDLDIVYIGDDKKISRIFSGVPRSYADTPEEKVAKVSARGRYVLELSSGTVARMGLKTGDALEFDLLGQTSR
ncbi:MAG: DUF192 domain-containing protein, partial [Elusimicrobia bacterium]|nr:DUF192 domain-containing protein [Elusimicrobiota bacterium]